ncbi:hypothetical protein [Sphingorhabdus sp.]|jgi:hypothetical protein|uniref:hypothetical protein n=1 Tax=Sphingorhabdus sp. TaxID=1902408 RepID=UPI0037C97BAC
MADERLIFAIGRIERALSRIEKLAISPSGSDDSDLSKRHEKLKSETLAAIHDMDKILAGAD